MTIRELDSVEQPGPELNLQYVGRNEYCDIALSFRKLVRCDYRDRGLLGLLDAEMNTCYVIPEKELFETVSARTTS